MPGLASPHDTRLLARFDSLAGLGVLDATEAHHLRVLRAQPGDLLELCDGAGRMAFGELLTLGREQAEVRLVEVNLANAAPRLHLAVGLLKGKDPEEVVEDCTQLPVASIQFLWTDHCQVPRQRSLGHLLERLREKARAGLKQSRQEWLCTIPEPLPLQEWLSNFPSNAQGLVLDPEGLPKPTLPRERPLWLAIGPEGGFSPREQAQMRIHPAFAPLSLGKTRLRARTAPLFALCVAQGLAQQN